MNELPGSPNSRLTAEAAIPTLTPHDQVNSGTHRGVPEGAVLSLLWARAVAHFADRPFLAFNSLECDFHEWTYKKFDTLVGLTAARFAELGVSQGSTVRVALFNSPALMLSWIAAARLSAHVEFLDPNAVSAESRAPVPHSLVVAGSGPGRPGAAAYPGSTVLEVNEHFAGALAGSPLFAHDELGSRRMSARLDSRDRDHAQDAVKELALEVFQADALAARIPLTSTSRWMIAKSLWECNALEDCVTTAIARGQSVAITSLFEPSQTLTRAREMGADRLYLTEYTTEIFIGESPSPELPSPVEFVWVHDEIDELEQSALARICGVDRERVASGPRLPARAK